MNIRISTGSLEIISSGTLRTGFESSVHFDFADIWFKFQFLDSDEPSNAEWLVSDDAKGMTCKVFVKDGLFGITSPERLGTLEDRAFFVSFEVSKPSQKHDLWVLNYSFYLGDKVDG